MPKKSERELLLDDVETAMKFTIFHKVLQDDTDSDDSSSSSMDSEMDPFKMVSILHSTVLNSRYLETRDKHIPKSMDFVENYFLEQSDSQFRVITRVNKETFFYLVELLKNSPIFQNNSKCPQAPLHWQLACALDRLGNNGQGVSHARSKFLWGLGQGTVHLYTQRVIEALCAMKDEWIRWPDATERRHISRQLARKGFPGAVGFVDGTTIPIHKKPAVSGNTFMDRKRRYSINAQIVCDQNYRIIFFSTGQPGSCSDSRAYGQTALAQNPERAFSSDEYLIADSGYTASETVVPAYKTTDFDDPSDPQEPNDITHFNYFLAQVRVVVEHTIGILKGWFTGLKEMRVDIHKKEDIQKFIKQAVACVVLHNMCMMKQDGWSDTDEDEDEEVEEVHNDPGFSRQRRMTLGQQKRRAVRIRCLALKARI
jgi:hypothetical protein